MIVNTEWGKKQKTVAFTTWRHIKNVISHGLSRITGKLRLSQTYLLQSHGLHIWRQRVKHLGSPFCPAEPDSHPLGRRQKSECLEKFPRRLSRLMSIRHRANRDAWVWRWLYLGPSAATLQKSMENKMILKAPGRVGRREDDCIQTSRSPPRATRLLPEMLEGERTGESLQVF